MTNDAPISPPTPTLNGNDNIPAPIAVPAIRSPVPTVFVFMFLNNIPLIFFKLNAIMHIFWIKVYNI
jgi:hypothetical protein